MDAQVTGISLAMRIQKNCKCWLLSTALAAALAYAQDCFAQAALRRPKQGCSQPEVLAQGTGSPWPFLTAWL